MDQEVNIIKTSILSKDANSMQSLLKIPMSFFKLIIKLLKIHLEPKRTPNSQKKYLREKKPRNVLSDFKIHYKTPIIKTLWYQHQSRLRDQRHKMENLGVILTIHDLLIFNKSVVSRTICGGRTGSPQEGTCTLSHTIHRNQLQLIEDLNVKPEL